MAFGRGFLATLTHTLLAMIFGLFLMRFVAHGWRQWHLVVIGYLAAAGAHALYDTGPVADPPREALKGDARPVDVASISVPIIANPAVPYVIGGITLVLVAGLWALRRAIRRAACDDLIVSEAHHQAVVRRWHLSGNIVLPLGALALIAAIAWAMLAEGAPQPGKPDLDNALIIIIGFASGVFAMIVGWMMWQKRMGTVAAPA